MDLTPICSPIVPGQARGPSPVAKNDLRNVAWFDVPISELWIYLVYQGINGTWNYA